MLLEFIRFADVSNHTMRKFAVSIIVSKLV